MPPLRDGEKMDKHYHKSPRLEHYDYRENGCYFVTVCTKGRCHILRQPVGAATCRPMKLPPLSEWGTITEQGILQIPQIYPHITLEQYTVMPNHIHLLLTFDFPTDAPRISLSTVIGNLKRWVSLQIGTSIWQKGFYDHIIRDENDFLVKWHYIDTNPLRWESDEFYT